MKKITYILAFLLLAISCGYSNGHRSEEELKEMNVRFNNLVCEGMWQFHQDSAKLVQAIALSDSILAEDTVTNRRISVYRSRSIAFMASGRKDDALKSLESMILLFPEDNVDRLVYMIHKNNYLQKTDSAQYYTDKAMQICDKNLSKCYNADWVLKKVEVIYIKSGEKASKDYLISESQKHPKDMMLKSAIEDWDNLPSMMAKSPFTLIQEDINKLYEH